MKHTLPVIGITMGDPVGIGPEIVLKAFSDPSIYTICRPVVFGDKGVLSCTDAFLSSGLTLNPVDTIENAGQTPGCVDILELSDLNTDTLHYGTPDSESGAAMIRYITSAVNLAKNNTIQGIVTSPVNKVAMKLAGSEFHGHTELIASMTDTDQYVMMLTGKTLSVVLVTIHVPFSHVTELLSTKSILKTIRITDEALKHRFGIKSPRIAVSALNPHAGEGGLFGNEEETIIIPAVNTACSEGIDVAGPLPPDTVFFHAMNGQFDVVVCMYHDQGLIPFKMIHFSDGVNTTLGLPIIRTSVDHGTAYDIAGKGIADPESLKEAIRLAARQSMNLITVTD